MFSRLHNLRLTLACLALLGLAAPRVSASPFSEVKPGDSLYERVKALGRYGLLDTADLAVLDQGEAVTRLQLAFYTEKAKSRLSNPVFPTPTPGGASEPTIQGPSVIAAPSIVDPSKIAAPEIVDPSKAQALPDLVAPTMAPAPALEMPNAVAGEIDDLLKALGEEQTYLRARLKALSEETTAREGELTKIKKNQEAGEAIARKANKNSGDWSFNTNSKWAFEDITVTGQAPAVLPAGTSRLAAQRVSKMSQFLYFGMWGSLGKGSLSTGIGASIPSTNDDSWPVSISIGRSELKLALEGRLGNWNLFAMDEGFQAQTTMGNFTRGVPGERPKQYERPFNIKSFADDQKWAKIWDDYIRALGFVETQSLVGGTGQSSSDRVFDGIVADGVDLPLLGPTKVKLLAGRMLPLNNAWYEYGTKLTRSFHKDRYSVSLAGIWVDHPTGGLPTKPSMDLRNYTGELTANLKPIPVALMVEGAWTHFFTGIDTLDPTNVHPLIGQAVQVQASSYPFNIYWQDIRPGYANFQSKVALTGFNLGRYGYGASDIDGNVDRYGEIGEANQLQSNRKGFRFNLGWNGRRDPWMQKSLPELFDYFVLNMDLASRSEHVAMVTDAGRYLIEPWMFVAPYYGDDEGVWGKDLYGGFGGFASSKAVRFAQMNNIRNARGWQLGAGLDEIRYRFCLSTERIPMVDPVTGANLSHLKTYHFLALTHKWQLNKIYGGTKPLYLGVYVANNRVSGKAVEVGQTDISNMFTQKVMDFTLRIGRLLPYVDLLGHYAIEKWDSAYTFPLVEYRTTNTGLGLDYDIPWGSAKFGFRWNHVVFENRYVPANNYQAEQLFGLGIFRF